MTNKNLNIFIDLPRKRLLTTPITRSGSTNRCLNNRQMTVPRGLPAYKMSGKSSNTKIQKVSYFLESVNDLLGKELAKWKN